MNRREFITLGAAGGLRPISSSHSRALALLP